MNATTQPLTRVAVVEDTRDYRNYLATIIDGTPGFACLGAYSTAEQALAQLPAHRPDVLLLDLNLPCRSGLDILPELKRRFPQLIVIVVTIEDSSEHIFSALEAGADGYLVKPVGPVDLVSALEDALEGGAPMSAPIARLVIRSFRDRPAQTPSSPDLTPLERDILRLLAAGHQRKEICQQLGLGLRTVAKYLRGIYDKLHAHSAPQAVAEFLASTPSSGTTERNDSLNNFQHEQIRARLHYGLESHNRVQRLGAVFGPGLGCRIADRNCCAPDLSFVPKARLRQLGFTPDTTALFPGAPDLAIEVLSPDKTPAKMQARLQDFFASGTQVAWLVDPVGKRVLIHRSSSEKRSVGLDGFLDGEHLLPGFRLAIADLFEPWDWD